MIFLSYSHSQADYADQVEEYLKQYHISLLRDKKSEKETDSIPEFVKKVGKADLVILLISDAYLKSYWCVYEALIAYSFRHRKNMIPIVLPDADLFTPGGQKRYIAHWEQMRAECEAELADCLPQHTLQLRKKLRQMEAYSNYLGDFMAHINDTVSILQAEGEKALKRLYACLCDRILSREIRYSAAAPVGRPDPMDYPEDPYLAIDFGTSYTLLSVVDRKGKIRLIPDRSGSTVHRSTIEFHENGDYLVGSDAPHALRHIKRAIGVRDTVSVGGERWSVTLLVAMILKSMIRNAEEYLGMEIRQVLMAVPTDFSLAQWGILRESARLAGVEVVRFVQESSAEVYLTAPNQSSFTAFIDLGGGTLDISLVDNQEGFYEVLYNDGDSAFGSLDFDDALEQFLAQKLLEEYGVEGAALGLLAEQIKCRLSTEERVCVTYTHSDPFGDIRLIPLTVTRQDFEAAARPLTERFERRLAKIQDEWSVPISRIYLTGQGTKLYMLKGMIHRKFPDTDIVDRYQESAVIRGLSVQNRVLMGDLPDLLLLDVISSRIVVKHHAQSEKAGLWLSAYRNSDDCCILEENTTIPVKKMTVLNFLDLPEDGTPETYPLEIFQVTASGRRNLLVHTYLTADPKKWYELTVEVDANSRMNITVESVDTDNARSLVRKYSV